MDLTIKSTEYILPHHVFVLEEYHFQIECLNFQRNCIKICISYQLTKANYANELKPRAT